MIEMLIIMKRIAFKNTNEVTMKTATKTRERAGRKGRNKKQDF